MRFSFSKKLLLMLVTITALSLQSLWSQDSWKEYVTIYDDFDEELFGRSVNRDILRGINIGSFLESDTYPAPYPEGYLTSVVLSSNVAERVLSGRIDLTEETKTIDGQEIKIFTFRQEGIRFSFSLEKPSAKVLAMISSHYENSKWKEPVLQRYRDNYIIRIFSAENIFDPWNEEITYNEALLAATMIGDYDQWLWGIHDGNNLLARIYLGAPTRKPDVFE